MSVTSIFSVLRQLRITLKKCHLELDRVNSAPTISSRKEYALHFISCAPLDMAKCMFIDESGFNLHLHRTQGRSVKGHRAKIMLPTIRGRNVTLIAAINSRGVIHTKIVEDSTCNGKKFCVFMTELMLELQKNSYYGGSWLIMDNARIHKTQELKDILHGYRYDMQFLSPYSYMMNPIENVFSKVKAEVRNMLAERGNEYSLKEFIKAGIRKVIPDDCQLCNEYV